MSLQIRHYALIASYALAVLGLLMVLPLQLLPALLVGLLVYELVNTLTPQLQRMIAGDRARWLAVALLAVTVMGLLVALVLGLIALFRSDAGSPAEFYQRALVIIDNARAQVPDTWIDQLPATAEEVQRVVVEWMGRNADTLQLAGRETLRFVVQLLIGMVLGALVAFHAAHRSDNHAPLAQALTGRCANLAGAFRDIVFAQVKISAVNTLLTGLFVLVGLPLFGIDLPLAKTLVVLTFVLGLLPVLGNLMSSTAIVVVGLSVSIGVAIAATVFLVVIHELEYFLNAQIVGHRIRSRAWELLLAMLVMEAAFGIAGLIAAPVYYAFLKRELAAAKLI